MVGSGAVSGRDRPSWPTRSDSGGYFRGPGEVENRGFLRVWGRTLRTLVLDRPGTPKMTPQNGGSGFGGEVKKRPFFRVPKKADFGLPDPHSSNNIYRGQKRPFFALPDVKNCPGDIAFYSTNINAFWEWHFDRLAIV